MAAIAVDANLFKLIARFEPGGLANFPAMQNCGICYPAFATIKAAVQKIQTRYL